jgi:tRNA U34 2-thiouridine synthase MnmA/TrmU/8-oxo-dGTP pyrophosphatase MutT (NUDIX family)
MPREISAGSVIYRIENGIIYYLLLYYPALSHRAKKDYCDFPKGHLEPGESDVCAMRREVAEETGIEDLEIAKGFRETIEYFFVVGEKKIFKIVTFYLAKTSTKKVTISPEHTGFSWLPIGEAVKNLSFSNSKKILKKANAILTKKPAMEKKKNKTAKALILMSGGLDSMLAAKLLMAQGVEVTLLCFKSYFFGCDAAKKAAAQLGLSLRVVDFSDDQFEVVKKPKYGRGGAINPCIDCHLLMIQKAGEIMEKEGFDFVATGEVLEERPLSQNKRSLDLIEQRSGLAGKLLRPLSAKLLLETEVEARGLVDRQKLEAISGRSRKRQLELAGKFMIKDIPQPSGGCILTEKDYGDKLANAIKIKPDLDGNDIQILRSGRVIFEGETLIVVARDKTESEALPQLAKKGDTVFLPENFPGPAVLLRDFSHKLGAAQAEEIGKAYLLKFTKKISDTFKIKVDRIQ